MTIEGVYCPIDLGAERFIAAERGSEKIVVEIKSFLAESLVNEFHTVLGQYLDYETGLEEKEPDRAIYLALPQRVWKQIQKLPFLLRVLDKFSVDMIIFEPKEKEIKQWIKK